MAQVIHLVKKLAAPRLGCRYLALDDFGHGAFDDFGQGVFDAE
ncbi:MAG: hypothetical protein Q8R92_07210 [Deltaproteobacteria bacterium]|nr:hypothetical protein [Deltaproteobacteria bacterium]